MLSNPAIVDLVDVLKAVDKLKDITEIQLNYQQCGAYSTMELNAKVAEKEIPIAIKTQMGDKVVTENVCDA